MVRILFQIPVYLAISCYAIVTSSMYAHVRTNMYHTLSWIHQKLNKDEAIELIFKHSKSVKTG
jgi:hypothetical protein